MRRVRGQVDADRRLDRVDAGVAFGTGDADWQAIANDTARVYDIVERGRITPRQVDDVRGGVPAFVNPSLSGKPAAVVGTFRTRAPTLLC